MKRNYVILILTIVILLAFTLFYERPVEDALPFLIMVDGELYQGYEITQDLPEDSVEGYIIKVVPNEIPKENQTANFGNVGMAYWISDGNIYIKNNECYQIFVPVHE